MQLHRKLTLFFLLAASACASATMLPVDAQPIAGTYTGLTVCADCAGITTTIVLSPYRNRPDVQAGTFTLLMVYKGRGTRVRITGQWDMLPPQDYTHGLRQEGIVRLIPMDDGTPSTPRYFYCLNGQNLRMLDGEMQELPDLVPHTLARVRPATQKKK